MSRMESLQNEHDGRVERKRMDTALPPRDACGRRHSHGVLWLVLAALAVAAGVAAWLFHGGRF